MAKKLDRSRDFGEIMGSDNGAAFVQDEILFDASGNELVIAGATPPKKATAAPVPKKATAAPVKPEVPADQVTAQLEGELGDFAA